MSDYIGVIELKQAIPCKKEVLGQIFKSKIANHDVLIIFPSIPDDYDPQKGPDLGFLLSGSRTHIFRCHCIIGTF